MKKETRKRLFFRNGELRVENEIWLSFYHHVHSPFSIFNFQLSPDFLLGLLIRTIVLYYILTKYSLRA